MEFFEELNMASSIICKFPCKACFSFTREFPWVLNLLKNIFTNVIKLIIC